MKYSLLLFVVIFLSRFTFAQSIVINEVNSDTPGIDMAEFIELYSFTPNFSLDGYVLVFFNGGDDKSYAAYDLDGYTTNSNGYFIVGDSGVTGVSITLLSSGLQNGPDAVALYQADKSDFPNDTSLTTTDLIDAIVYKSINSHTDDTELLTGLGETVQYNENASNDSENHSLQRQSDGSFKVGISSPNSTNLVLNASEYVSGFVEVYPNPVSSRLYFKGLKEKAKVSIYSLTGQRVLQQLVQHQLDVSALVSGMYMLELRHGKTMALQKLIKQ